MSNWKEWAICPKCRLIFETSGGWAMIRGLGQPSTDLCPRCATHRNKFEVVIGRKVSDATWWKPWTWLNSRLEKMEGGK